MDETERGQKWVESLGGTGENVLFLRYVFTKDYSGIEEFALVYSIAAGGRYFEVIRFDWSSDERAHVHRFYCNPPAKMYLEKEKSFETILGFYEDVRKNWRIYRMRFIEEWKYLYNL